MAKYQAYAEYKDSGVEWLGEIPCHWDLKPIKYLFEIINGSTPKSGEETFWDGEITWITPSDLSKLRSQVIGESIRTITKKGLDSCGTSLVPSDTIILSCRAPIGSLAVTSKEACTNQGCKSLVKKYDLSTKFFYYYLSISTKQLNNLGRGTTFLELSSDELGSYALGIPNAEEQTQIANFLDHETAKIDNLIQQQQQLIELLKEKRQAVISHAVTKGLDPSVPMKDSGVEWLGEVPEHWGIVRLKHLILGNLVYGANEAAEDDNPNNPRYIRITDMNNDGSLDPNTFRSLPHHIAENYLLEDGDILLARSGATVGKSFLFKDEFGTSCFAGYLIRARSDKKKLNPKFAYWFFQSESYWKYVSGSQIQATIQNVSAEKYGDLYLSVPEILVQEQISNFLECEINKIDNLIAKAESAIQLMQERRTALISAAVTGKIDVRHWQAPTVAEAQTELSA